MAERAPYRPIHKQFHTGGMSALWESDTHLLLVRNGRITESYRRFYFNDIQALTIERNHYRFFQALSVGLCLAPLALLSATGLMRAWSVFATAPMLAITALLVIPFILNILRGATCKVYIKTPVQTDVLEPLTRVKVAERFLARVLPQIETVQGVLDEARIAEVQPAVGTAAAGATPRSSLPPRPRHNVRGTWHVAVYLLLLVSACTSLGLLVYFRDHIAFTISSACLFIGIAGSLIGALVTQHRSTLPAALQRLTWFVLAYFCAIAVITWGYTLFRAITAPGASSVLFSSPFFPALMGIDCITSAALGLIGLMMLKRYLAQRRIPAPPPWKHQAPGDTDS